MRMGKRMKQLLKVLKEANGEPLTLSQMVVKIYDGDKTVEKWRGVRINKVASALAKGAISWDSAAASRKFSEKGKEYHPHDYASVLYASYSRALQTLFKYDLVRCGNLWKRNRKVWILNVKKPFVNV